MTDTTHPTRSHEVARQAITREVHASATDLTNEAATRSGLDGRTAGRLAEALYDLTAAAAHHGWTPHHLAHEVVRACTDHGRPDVAAEVMASLAVGDL